MGVKIRIDSLPYSQFGYLKGTVKSIGDEVANSSEISTQVQSNFPVYITLENQYLEKEGVKYCLKTFRGEDLEEVKNDLREYF